MSVSSSMEAKLKSAESSLAFAQSEHKKVLAQLHQEIQKLQQKCADLQFALTSSAASVQAEEDLRVQLHTLQLDKEEMAAENRELRQCLSESRNRTEELQTQLQWQALQQRNQLESVEAKLAQLQRQSDVSRLQNEVAKLYEDEDRKSEQRMEAVVRRARRPEEQPQQETGPPSSLESSVSRHHKLIRTKLQRTIKLEGPSSAAAALALPSDYRASVSKLPPIASRGNSCVASRRSQHQRRQSLMLEVDVLANTSPLGVATVRDVANVSGHDAGGEATAIASTGDGRSLGGGGGAGDGKPSHYGL